MREDETLDALQRELLDALERGEDARAALRRSDPEWAAQADDRMLRLAGQLVRVWARGPRWGAD